MYNGLQFAGVPEYLECAESFSKEGICSDTVICAIDGSTHVDVILENYPNASIATAPAILDMYSHFSSGFCNVLAAEQFDIAEKVVRDGSGYIGPYEMGTKVHSKEPLALVSREDDIIFSDFLNWIMVALITAEDEGITSETAASILPTTDIFGDEFSNMFRDAVALVGNYGEIYERNLEHVLPRPTPDYINDGKSGLMYAYPFGTLESVGPTPKLGGTMDVIIRRGKLICGVEGQRPFFAVKKDGNTNEWSGTFLDTIINLPFLPGEIWHQSIFRFNIVDFPCFPGKNFS